MTQVFVCNQLGVKGSYLSDVANGKNTMSEDRIRIIAEILDTSYEYLTDQTDDPLSPDTHKAEEIWKQLAKDTDFVIPFNGASGRGKSSGLSELYAAMIDFGSSSIDMTKKLPDTNAGKLKKDIIAKVLEMEDEAKLEAVLKMLEVMG
jgi:transcriptional regulator with XRE-family HTH domain